MNQGKDAAEAVLIVNPHSAGGSTYKNWEEIYSKIKEILGDVEIAFTKKSGDGTKLARHFLRQGFQKVIALGGDGTINEVANGFFEEIKVKDYQRTNGNTLFNLLGLRPLNPKAIMGLIPSGSRNVLAKSLGLPEGIVECSQRYVEAKPRKMDVVVAAVKEVPESPEMEVDDHNLVVRTFLNAAEIGAGAEIIDRSKRIRDRIPSRTISTISSVVATLPTYESNVCEINIDNGQRRLISKMTMAVIANGRYLDGGFTAAPHANISDGLLDLTILQNSGSFKMLEGFLNMQGKRTT